MKASGITPQHAAPRGYKTVTDPRDLAQIGIAKAGQRTRGLLIPLRCKDGSVRGYQYRPDHPRQRKEPRSARYRRSSTSWPEADDFHHAHASLIRDGLLRVTWPVPEQNMRMLITPAGLQETSRMEEEIDIKREER